MPTEIQNAERTVQGRGQSATLQQRIVTFVRDNPTATFAELMQAFPENSGDQRVTLGPFENIVLWDGLDCKIIDALVAAEAAGEIHMTPSSVMVYLFDGAIPTLPPITGNPLKLKKPHWLPVVFNPGPKPKVSAAERDRLFGSEGGAA